MEDQVKNDDLIDDPENPNRKITLSTWKRRLYDREEFDDPDKPGKKITRGALNKRKYANDIIDDPDNPEKKITRASLTARKRKTEMVPDPDNPGQTISRHKLYERNFKKQRTKLVPDPENDKLMITLGSLDARKQNTKLVPDPRDDKRLIMQGSLSARKKSKKTMVDPKNPHKMVSKGALYKRKWREQKEYQEYTKKEKITICLEDSSEDNDKQGDSSMEDLCPIEQFLFSKEQKPILINKQKLLDIINEPVEVKDPILIKQEPTSPPIAPTGETHYRVARMNGGIYIDIKEEEEEEDMYKKEPTSILQQPIKINLTNDQEVGDLDKLYPSSNYPPVLGPKYDINSSEDIERLKKDDHLVEYLHSSRKLPLEIRNVYAIGGEKGVFALEDIHDTVKPLGQYMGEYTPSEGKLKNPDSVYVFGTEKGDVDALEKRDWTAYVNHSPIPNVRCERGPKRIQFYASRIIKAGEQLLIDYGQVYFKVLGFTPLYLCAEDGEESDECKIIKYKEAYHPKIISWTQPHLQSFFDTGGLDHDIYVVPRLFLAILNDDIQRVQSLLKESPLDICAYAVERIGNGFQVLPPSRQQHITPLMLACYCGHEEIIRVLVKAGADLNRPMLQRGDTPLSLIVNSGYDNRSLANFILNETHERVQNFDYLLRICPKIINLFFKLDVGHHTIETINRLLTVKGREKQELLRISLNKAINRISIVLFRSADFRIVDTIWSRIVQDSTGESFSIKWSREHVAMLNSTYLRRKSSERGC